MLSSSMHFIAVESFPASVSNNKSPYFEDFYKNPSSFQNSSAQFAAFTSHHLQHDSWLVTKHEHLVNPAAHMQHPEHPYSIQDPNILPADRPLRHMGFILSVTHKCLIYITCGSCGRSQSSGIVQCFGFHFNMIYPPAPRPLILNLIFFLHKILYRVH